MTDTTKEIIEKNTVKIHNNDYLTVAGRVQLFHEDHESDIYIETKNRVEAGFVICEAVVRTKKGTFCGTSAVSLANARNIEKENPFEVAETSAVGRALGFANYGLNESIATADEIRTAIQRPHPAVQKAQAIREKAQEPATETVVTCSECGEFATVKSGVSAKTGKPWRGIFCSADREHVKWLKADVATTDQTGTNDAPPQSEGNAEEGEVDPDSIPF